METRGLVRFYTAFCLLLAVIFSNLDVGLAQPRYAVTTHFYHDHIEENQRAFGWGRQDWINWRDVRDRQEDARRRALQHRGRLPQQPSPFLREKRLNSVLLTNTQHVAQSLQGRQRGQQGNDVWSDRPFTMVVFQQPNGARNPNAVLVYQCQNMFFAGLLNNDGWPYHFSRFNPMRFNGRQVSLQNSCILLR